MRAESETLFEDIKQALKLIRRRLDYDNALQRLEALNEQSQKPDLWENPDIAQKIMREREHLNASVNSFQALEQALNDSRTLIEMGEEEKDEEIIAEGEQDLKELSVRVERVRLESLLSGEADNNDCYLEVHAGAGGTEAQDWALMLMRMYARWAEAHHYKVEWLEESAGDGAGIKSCTLKIVGLRAYGWLKTENGVHRLVRISPFDSSSRRHTSFASIRIYPVIDDNINIVVEEKDIRVDTYRSSGAGGQHVNTTDSAVRITHLPTNIAVQCQNDRSQHRNRAQAMDMLKARLFELELQKREQVAQQDHAAKTDIGWGHQIRSYVLHPYQMVKDLRTSIEKGNAQGVLDGDLDPFLEAALAARV
ncbi:MAG: peptide chain release factor 2 [Alphaproteobacteria bacterium]|nr:peptide chain release factor 2 [Alphaproteobacteria bacterium]